MKHRCCVVLGHYYLVLYGCFILFCHGMMVANERMVALESQGLFHRPCENLYILGTIHIGSTSAEDAEFVIGALQPSTVIVELPPSRLSKNKGLVEGSEKEAAPMDMGQVWGVLPAMVDAGLSMNELSGMIVMVGILWASLLRQSMSSTFHEAKQLPRRNEFHAAINTAESIGATVVPADWELEELVERLSFVMTLSAWLRLVSSASLQALGLQDTDPLNRERDESMHQWEMRRRRLETSQASRRHGARTAPEIHQVLVSERDEHFAQLCRDALEKDGEGPVLCVVGLVHAIGLVDKFSLGDPDELSLCRGSTLYYRSG